MLLQNLQAEFAEVILSGEQTYIAIPEAHLTIYKNNVIATLSRTLLHIYPLIAKLLGEDFFHISAKKYITSYPSRSSNLHDYGEYFSHFLAEYAPVKNLTYLPEVASFEWICHQLHFAADHDALDISLLENMSPESYGQLHFHLHPASRVMKFHYPLLQILKLCKGEIEEIKDLHAGGINLLIIRRESAISFEPLTHGEYTFLTALTDGKILSTALAEAVQVDAHFKLDEKLPTWIKTMTIVDCYLA